MSSDKGGTASEPLLNESTEGSQIFLSLPLLLETNIPQLVSPSVPPVIQLRQPGLLLRKGKEFNRGLQSKGEEPLTVFGLAHGIISPLLALPQNTEVHTLK